jgi:hypothetical protein
MLCVSVCLSVYPAISNFEPTEQFSQNFLQHYAILGHDNAAILLPTADKRTCNTGTKVTCRSQSRRATRLEKVRNASSSTGGPAKIVFRFCFYGNNELPLWIRVLPEKLRGPQLVKKFPAFYGTRRSIASFISARYLYLPEPDQCSPRLPTPLHEGPF